MGFDERWAQNCVDQLQEKGVEFADGLEDQILDEVSFVFGADVPAELRLFLRAGLPISPKWARWQDGPRVVLARTREWIGGAFDFDIRHNDYWHPLLGHRPSGDDAAVDLALAFLASAPPLLPLYGHRFLVTQPVDGTRAVLSVWQAVDSIYYGNDLADYLAHEFNIDRPSWAAPASPPVPTWDELFEL